MKTDQEILSSILKTTQMGQTGIRCVKPHAKGPGLKAALDSQLREYDTIEDEAHAIARARSWEVPELSSGVRAMSHMMSRCQLMYRSNDSQIAGMMIQGNTRGMILGLKNMRRCNHPDSQVAQIAQKLLETEKNNIVSMEGFL